MTVALLLLAAQMQLSFSQYSDFWGTYMGSQYGMSISPNINYQSSPGAVPAGSITIYTDDATYTCLIGQNLAVWYAPNATYGSPGNYITSGTCGSSTVTLTFPQPILTYSGTFDGQSYSLSLVGSQDVSHFTDAKFVGTLSDFQTSNDINDPPNSYACINGNSLDVWSAPDEYPGIYLVTDWNMGYLCGTTSEQNFVLSLPFNPVISQDIQLQNTALIPGAYNPLTFNVLFSGSECTSACSYEIILSNNTDTCPPPFSIPSCYPTENTLDGCTISSGTVSSTPLGLTTGTLNTYTPGNAFPGNSTAPSEDGICYYLSDPNSATSANVFYYTGTPQDTYAILPASPPPPYSPTLSLSSSAVPAGQPIVATFTPNSQMLGVTTYLEFSSQYGAPYGSISQGSSSENFCVAPKFAQQNCPSPLTSQTPDCLLYTGTGATSVSIATSVLDPGLYTMCGYSEGTPQSGITEPTNGFIDTSFVISSPCGIYCPSAEANFNPSNILIVACNGYTSATWFIVILALALIMLGVIIYTGSTLMPGTVRGTMQGYAAGMILAGVVGVAISVLSIWLLLTVTNTNPSTFFSQTCGASVTYTYTGAYQASQESLTKVSIDQDVATLQGAVLVGQLVDFQTDDPSFSCLDGTSMDVYTVPYYAGQDLATTTDQASPCALITLSFPST